MKELVEKWRSRVSEWKSHPMFGAQENIQAAGLQASAYEVEQCIKELEATHSPRPIEEAPSGQRIDVWTHWEGDMVVTRWPDCYVVDGVLRGPHGPMSCPPVKASIIGWTPVPVVSIPLPSMDGGEK